MISGKMGSMTEIEDFDIDMSHRFGVNSIQAGDGAGVVSQSQDRRGSSHRSRGLRRYSKNQGETSYTVHDQYKLQWNND